MPKRPENGCRKCGNKWPPRGRDLAQRCPRCGSPEVYLTGAETAPPPATTDAIPASAQSPIRGELAPEEPPPQQPATRGRLALLGGLAVLAGGIASLVYVLSTQEDSASSSPAALGHASGSVVPAAAYSPPLAGTVAIDELRETWKHGQRAVFARYGGRPLQIQAVVSYHPGQTHFTFPGIPPIICHMASGWAAAQGADGRMVSVTARLQGFDSAGMHLSDCQVSPH